MECSPLYQRFLILIHMFLYWSLETCNFFFLFSSIHLIFMENFINVIMKRNKFHAMTYPPRQTFMPQ